MPSDVTDRPRSSCRRSGVYNESGVARKIRHTSLFDLALRQRSLEFLPSCVRNLGLAEGKRLELCEAFQVFETRVGDPRMGQTQFLKFVQVLEIYQTGVEDPRVC